MADTKRTITALTDNLFQDGQADGAITPQSMRDLIVSFQAEWGMLYVSSPATTGAVVADTYELATGTSSAIGTPVRYTVSNANRLTYNGTPNRTAIVVCSVSLELDSAATDDELGLEIHKNGTLITGTTMVGYANATTATAVNITTFAIVPDLSTNDYIEPFIANVDTTSAITPRTLVMGVFNLVQ